MDVIRQIGLGLRQTKKDSKYAIDRTARHFPIIERVSDYLTGPSAAVPAGNLFAQEFKTYHHDDEARLSLNFGPDVVSVPVPCNTCGCDCGITDTFTRSVSGGWGTSDSRLVWSTLESNGTASVDGDSGVITLAHASGGCDVYGWLPVAFEQMWSMTVRFARSAGAGSYTDDERFWWGFGGQATGTPWLNFTPPYYCKVYFAKFGTSPTLTIGVLGVGNFSTTISRADATYTLSVEMTADVNGPGVFRVKCWHDGESEPGWLEFTDFEYFDVPPSEGGKALSFMASQFDSQPDVTYSIDSLDITDVNRCNCGITDTFTRTVATGWGTSDSGLEWVPYIYDNLGTTTRGVDGSRAWYSSSQSTKMSSLYLPTTPNPQDWTTVVSISRLPTGSPDGPFIFILGENSSAPIIYFWIGPRLGHTLSSLQLVEQSYVDTKGNGYAGYPTITANTDYSIRWYRDDLISKVKLWATASTEPSDWLIEIPSGATPTTPTTHQSLIAISLQSTSTTLTTGYVNEVNITGVDRCTEFRFDNFDRTVPAEWGTSSDGHLWVTNLGSYNGGTILDTASVGSGVGTVVVHGGSTVLSIGDATAPWAGDTFTMTARFSIASAPTDVLTTSTLAFHPGSTLSGAYIQMAFTAGPPATGVAKSYIIVGNGDHTFIPPSFWSDGGTYTLTLAVSGLSETATIVGAGGTYSATGNRPFASNGNFSVHPSWYTSGFQTFTFDYIDFDYDGKPCY